MNIAVLGTGMVGQALAGKLSALGHEVTVGTRDVETTLARTEPDVVGNPPFAVWRADYPDIGLATPRTLRPAPS
jgi:predicted dinucleotide-binding enzyme